MPDPSLVSQYESAVEMASSVLWDMYQQVLAYIGDRPFGWVAGDRLDQAAWYLNIRDDAGAWQQMATQLTQQYGTATAAAVMAREITRMEELLQRMGGYESVQVQLLERRVQRAGPGLRAAQKLLEMPTIQVLPPLPPFDEMALLAPQPEQPALPQSGFQWQTPGDAPELPQIFRQRVDEGINTAGDTYGPVNFRQQESAPAFGVPQ